MDKSDLVKFRSECIAAHNFYRSLHGTTPLVWSTRLADGAQKWAEQLASADSLTYSQERGIGENIACLWGSDVTGNKVTQIWYEESQNYDYSAPRVTPNNRPFCQVVWEGTRELGAGKAATKNGKQVVVARYHPPASRKQVEKNVKSPKLDLIDGSTTLATRASVGLRKFQEECLFAHNEFRVLHGAPPLHWSPSLAWAAQQWAEELVQIGELKHNNDEMVGENLAGMVGDELTGKECTDMWYEEVKDFDFENPCYSEETSNFTQVVWIGSELLGVGRATSGDTCIVVSFYEPPGNIEGLFGANVRLQGTKVKTYRLTKEMKTFIPPSPDLDWFRIECLVAHNYFRARHGAPPLVIGQALNEEAQYWAERLLVTGATEDLQESRIGINVAIIHGHHVSGLKVTELWYEEGTDYNFESPGFSLSTRSFTQLIWLSSRKLGIGKATNNSGQCVIVARYEPVGNIDGLFVANVRRRGHERNSLEPMIFESDVKYRFKVEGRRSFRMSWEVEGTQTLQAVDKTRDKTRRKEQAQPAYLSSPETFTRLVWIESPVLPRKQMRESCDLEMEKSDEDKESGVEEGEEFEQEEPSFIVVQPIAEPTAAGKQCERTIVYTEPQRTARYPDVRRSLSLDSEGTEPEPEEGHVHSRVAYFEHFEKIEKEKLDRPKRSSIELKEQLRHDQYGTEEAKGHKISEHEETVCQLEYDDVFPKHDEHDEHDERDDDFASEGEAEEDDDDVMSLETVSEAEEDLLEELDEYEMDHHIKSYCYEEKYPREEDERDVTQDKSSDERDHIAEIIETELDKMDKEQASRDPDHYVASSVDREHSVKDQMRVADAHIEFVPIEAKKRSKEFNPDDVKFEETEEEKELFKYEIKTPEKEEPSRPLCTESVDSETRDRVECQLNVDDMFTRLDKTDKQKGKPPPTLPKPKRRSIEEAPAEPRKEIIRTVKTTEIVETVHRTKTEPEPVRVQKEEIVETSRQVIEEKTTEPTSVETVRRIKTEPQPVTVQREEIVETSRQVIEEKPTEPTSVETVRRIKTEPQPVTVQREEIVETSRQVLEEKPTEPTPVETESKEQSEEEEDVGSDEEALESFDLSFIDRERKLNNIFKRLGRRIELLPTTETKTSPREFDRNIDLSDTKEEEELFRVYDSPVVDKARWNKNPVEEETIFAEHRKRDVESEIDFEEMFERLDKGEETPSKKPVPEPSQDIVLESETVEEPQEEKAKVVRFEKTVVIQQHETVYKDYVELKDEPAVCDDYEDVQEESAEDVEDHVEEYEEVDEARTKELQQITPAPPVHLAHECEEPSELSADPSIQEEEEAESYGEEEEVRTSVSPMDTEETPVQFSEELSEHSDCYGTCEVDTTEPRNSVADVYEEYEPPPGMQISETSCSKPIHVAADVENKPLESGVEERSVRTTMYESFEEVLPEASASPVIEPSTCYVAAEINHRVTEVEPVQEEVEVAALSSDEEPETIDKIAVRGIPESTESTVCITTETTYHHRTEIVQKRAPSIEVEMPLENEEEDDIEDEASYKEILTNGHCTSVHISHDIDETKTEVITETESYETEISQTIEEDKVAVCEVRSDHENVLVQLQEEQEEKVEKTVEREEEKQVEEAVPVTEDVEEQVEEREEEKEEEIVEQEEVEQVEGPAPVTEDVEEQVEEREGEKVDETVEEEEEEQVEEAVPVTEDVEEQVEEREEEKEEETVEEEEEEQVEEAVPVSEDVEEQVEEREEEKEEETVEEEEEEQVEEAVPVTEDVEEQVEEREGEKVDETVEEEEEEQVEEAVPVTEDVEEQVEEREEEKEEETVEEEEEEQVEEAVPVSEDVEEQVEEREEEKEEETVEEEEEEQVEEAVPVSEDVEEQVEEREEEKMKETVEEEEEEQVEEAVPVSEDVEEQVEEREEEKEEETLEEEEEEQVEEAVPVSEDVEEQVEEREEEKEEETVEEEEEEQVEEAVPVSEDVEEQVEEREEEKEEETVEEEEEEQVEEAVSVLEEQVEDREEAKVEETVQEEKEDKQEAELEFPDGSEKETEEQVEEAETHQVFEVEKSQTLAVDDRFEYISEEELEETEELYEALRGSFEEQDNEELIDEENVYVQQAAAGIIHIGSQEEENYKAFVEEASEDEISYDSEVITEVEKEITSALVVKESFSSAVCEDEAASKNVDLEERETESPVEETQPEKLLQFSEPVEEDLPEEYAGDVDVGEQEPDASHDDNDDVFLNEEQMEPPETPELEECEELESSDETIDKKVELIQFTEETTEEEKVASEEEVYEEEKAASESEERPATPDAEEEGEEKDDLESSGEFAEENVELIQFNEQEDEDKVVDEGFEVDEPYPLSPDVIEEKQVVTESGVELIQFTEQAEEKVEEEEDKPSETPKLERQDSEDHKDEEQTTAEKTEFIQFVEQTEEVESAPNGQAEELLEEYVSEDSGKVEVEEEIVISQPIACSTPIFLDEEEQHEESTSFEDSAEAGFGEEYEDMEKIVAHDHSLDMSEPISLEESSELSSDFYKAEAEETASKAVAEEFDDSSRIETEQESLDKVEEQQEQRSVTSTSVVTTTVYEKRIISTEHTQREVVDFTPLESAEVVEHEEHSEDHFSPPPIITATEFVADEEEEGSEEEYIPNFEHPRTYMVENKEVVMDRNAVESKGEKQDESAPLEEKETEEHEQEPAVEIQAPSEMETETKTEVVEIEPEKFETKTKTVIVSHRSEVVRKQESDVDDLEEKELEERIHRKQEAMEEKLLQEEIKEDIPDNKTTESEESRTELFFTSISVVKVAHEDDEQRIFREEEATMKMMEDEQKLEEEKPSTEELDVKEDEALTESAFRAEREEEHIAEDTSDEPDQGQKEDEVAQVPIIPLMAASDIAYRTSKSDTEIHEDVDYQEEIEVERIESSIAKEEESKTHPVLLTDVDFTEEIEVEKVPEEPEEKEDGGGEDVYEEEVEIQRVDNQEEGFEEEYHDDAVFEEEVMIEKIEEEHEEEQESFPDAASLPAYEEELDVAAQQVQPQQQPAAAEQNIVQADPVQEDARIEEEHEQEQESSPDSASLPVYEEELDVAADQEPRQPPDAAEENIVRAEPVHEDVGENNEVEQIEEEEQAWEEYEEMEEQDQEIPQEIQGIADQNDMHLYDNNNNESLPRYYVDFSPGGSFEHESTTSDDGEGPEVYRQGEPMEEDMEEFILVKYEDQSSSSGEDVSDHREMYVIHEEDSEDHRTDEKKQTTEGSQEEKVAYDQGFVNPALEDIREEEEEEKQKQKQVVGEGEDHVDIEEKRQLEEYERLESFVILEEKLSQVESDESVEELTSGTDGKRASSEETLNDEDELSETRTSSTLKDETTGSKDDASGDEASSPESQEPSGLDTTLTKEIEEETIDLEDGGVLSKRTVREESYSIEEDDGDDDDKDKTLTRKKVSKKVITATSTSETHIRRIESEDHPSSSGSDNEGEHQEERTEDVTTTDTTEQPEKQSSGDEESRKEIEESPESRKIETEEETIDLDDGGVVKKFVTREETYTVEGGDDPNDDEDSSISRKTVTRKVVTTTTTSTSRVTRLDDEPSSSFSDDDANRAVESSEETHTTIIKSRQPEESLVTAKRQLSLETSGASSEACADPSRKRRGCIKRFDSHDSEGHSSEVSSTTDSTGDSTSISSEGHMSDEDYSGLDEFQIDCIRQHNIYRHRHRACRLLWSENLASAAAEWADHLAATKTLEHSPQKECGENLACAKGYDLRGDKVADMWYDEITDYNFETPAFNAKCGHFTQMIWRGTKEFGVAKTIADDGCQYVVARYSPPGNVLGEFRDSIRRARGQRSSVRKRRRSSARRQLSHSSDMSDVLQREKFKNECVISHNYYRSLHGAPPLQWSTLLANEAQTFAEKLTKSGSFMHSGSKEIGECLAFSFGLDLSGRDTVDTWYDEIVDYDYEYPGYTSHTANFTQVVWAGSREFGMGKAVGDDGSCVVVGKYYPPGNIVGEFQENVKQKGTGYY